ncbi:hypothetical protein ACIO3O_34745 [Streptomyces sp. NPDC087440]|uniref:hypothetical protein n=1 Tax=Streptomyces sp. NPDC087440 TaxID=3365790 RepID=UPI003828AAE8
MIEPGDGQSRPAVALYPGSRVGASRVDTHVQDDRPAGGQLTVYITQYPAEMPDLSRYLVGPVVRGAHEVIPPRAMPDRFCPHRLAMAPPPDELWRAALPPDWTVRTRVRYEASVREHEQWATQADALVGMEWAGYPAELVLDGLMTQYPFATVATVLLNEPGRCRVGIRLVNCNPPSPGEPSGYMVTMQGPDDAPTAVFGSALLGWAQWWLRQDTGERKRQWSEVPHPPEGLVVTEAWAPYRVEISDVEHTRWPRNRRPSHD